MTATASFARRDEGQHLLENVEQFGFPGVDSVRDLTEPQEVFLAEARRVRAERQSPDNP